MNRLSPRLDAVLAALPLSEGMWVLEIGCGPGALARAMAGHIGSGHVLGIDRSAAAIAQAMSRSGHQIANGTLSFRTVAIEDFTLDGPAAFDMVVAIRVGALDGRHPVAGRRALARIRAALVPGGRLFIDGGNPLREIGL